MKIADLNPAARLEPQSISIDVLLEKYAKGGETGIDDVRRRIADALAQVEPDPAQRAHWAERFFATQVGGFIPGGRICSSAGTQLKSTLINCFVQPVGDSISGDAHEPGIFPALNQAAETMRRGGGVGYDFSTLRPEGAHVHGTASRSSGPISYMRVFDSMCQTVESAGARRGAQMAVLRCDHPDVLAFVHAKDKGELSNFNLSVACTDEFMRTVDNDGVWQLVHRARPSVSMIEAGARQRADGVWIYQELRARELFDAIVLSTYDHAEPGVVFIDRINEDNNLGYCETIAATNPCGEQPLPPYGCCDLGSMNTTRFVVAPFSDQARFDFDAFEAQIQIAVRMLDNVLDATVWPLPEQAREAAAKRRIGLGFTGLGDTLIMLGLRFDTAAARQMAADIAQALRDAAYRASIGLARERGPFPLFDADEYLRPPRFASRLPDAIQADIRQFGIRNSHLVSIAPTGTISLAFADNASNGIEPPFSWTYQRKKRMPDGSRLDYDVQDHAWRLFRAVHLLGDDVRLIPHDPALATRHAPGQVFDLSGQPAALLSPAFVSALDIAATDHMLMSAAVQPYVDSAISKTVNVPADYDFQAFKSLYIDAWRAGLKGLTTYRPNAIVGSVLAVSEPADTAVDAPQDLNLNDPDRRLRLAIAPTPALASLRWPGRPILPNGNPCWTYSVRHPLGNFAVFIGHVETDGSRYPFEVWVNGSEQPRGLGALAKTLSMDMRADDRAWLDMKLRSLEKTSTEDAFELAMPPEGQPVLMPSLVAGFARLVRHRCIELGAFDDTQAATPVMNALIGRREPKAGPDGTMSWTVDVLNPATGDDFCLFLKELVMPNGQRRPYSMWLAGEYPKAFDGLCKALSLDMWVLDPAWIGMKLRKLLTYGEPNGAFFARTPGSDKSRAWPSTIAYLAALMLHRYERLGILDDQGNARVRAGILDVPQADTAQADGLPQIAGRRCTECGNRSLIRRDGCEFCTSCGHIGACG